MAQTIKYFIHLRLIRSQTEGTPWLAGGVIEDFVRGAHPDAPKGGTTGRCLRAMTEPPETGLPAHLLKKIESGFVWYRINPAYGRPIVAGKPLVQPFSEKKAAVSQ